MASPSLSPPVSETDPLPVIPLSSASKIASYHIQPPTGPSPLSQSIELSQAIHRVNLVNFWGSSAIHPGSQILELGCGQGTCTAVLAEAVSSSPSSQSSTDSGLGHITALDPAPATYGAPFTLGQAQSHLTASPAVPFHIRSSISFHLETDLFTFFSRPENESKRWDTAILAHCIFYFPSPQKLLRDVLAALRGRVHRVCVAEYALQASEAKAIPHVFAALARATAEAHKQKSEENIQGLVSPDAIKEILRETGWRTEKEGMVIPDKELSDGYWETSGVVSDDGFLDEIVDDCDGDEGAIKNDDEGGRRTRIKDVLRASRDATVSAVKIAGGIKEVRTMDVWVAVLVRDE